jgi:hypothetical protein
LRCLDLIDRDCKSQDSQLPTDLQLEEFWSSEEYFFHDDQQMSLVAKMCPRMRKIMFQFNPEVATDLLRVLQPFHCLTELHNWGGDFYADKISSLLDIIGVRLKTLYLIHVDELDIASIALISAVGSSLQNLGFYNCIFRELTDGQTTISSM